MAKDSILNGSVSLYDGDFQASFDCPGRCKHALFYVDPPGIGDECINRTSGGNCQWLPAHVATMKAIVDRLNAEIEKTKGE